MENNKKSSKMYILLMLLVLCFFSIAIFSQHRQKLILDKEIQQITKEIEKEKKTSEDLKKQINFHDSDDFIEKIAREQLGLVKPNEILFIDQNE